jgi:hypothetical protein
MNTGSIKNKNVSKKTLDTQHNDKLQGFLSKESHIKTIQTQKLSLQKQASLLEKKKKLSDLTDEEFSEYMRIQDEISGLTKDLQTIERTYDEVDYYVNVAPILFKYYDILDKGNNINDYQINKCHENSILKYFMQPPSADTVEKKTDDDRATLLDKYMCYNSENYYKEIDSECKDRCQFCNSSNRNTMLNDGLIVCNVCSTIENIIIDHDRPSYKDPPKEISYFAYCLWAIKSYIKTIWLVLA